MDAGSQRVRAMLGGTLNERCRLHTRSHRGDQLTSTGIRTENRDVLPVSVSARPQKNPNRGRAPGEIRQANHWKSNCYNGYIRKNQHSSSLHVYKSVE
ncbi:hypothetical protein RvY_06741 [Ramazzottius varieornatus]|uniref:Uncharacterized protein n=1 Tax=Ramazzottius varieornatus TaxID=947166 RepID=A0A1D1V8A8_RAMVA|nr:hypothetical protein RvY_06741 [Ramazzottius varieornatus]